MGDKANETSAEARGTDAPTPPEKDDASSSASTDTQLQGGNAKQSDQAGGQNAASPARQQAEAIDHREREVFDRLEAGDDVRSARTAQPPATPSAEQPTAAAGGKEQQQDQQQQAAGGKLGFADYGMEEKTFRTLGRADMLPPTPEEWKQMPSWARGHLVSAANQSLKAKQESFNAAQAAAQQTKPPPAGQGAADDDELPDSTGRAGASGKGQEAAKPGQGKAASNVPALDAALDRINDYFGGQGEELVQPLREVLTQIAGRSEEQVREARAEVLQLQADRAFDSLQEEIPQLKDDAGRMAVIPMAGALLAARLNAGDKTASFGSCCRDAARAHFHPDLKQQAQQDLLDSRKKQVTGGVSRVGGNANPQRGLTADEKDRQAYAGLESGKDPQQIRRDRL